MSKSKLNTWMPLALAGLCAACGEAQPVPEVVLDPVPAGTNVRFTGTLTLTGRMAQATQGTIEVSVRREANGPSLLSRTYAVDDPARVGDVLAFGLSRLDAVVDPLPTFSRSMVLVARFDKDGDPKTRAEEDFEANFRVDTGATDLFVALRRTDADGTRAAQVETR